LTLTLTQNQQASTGYAKFQVTPIRAFRFIVLTYTPTHTHIHTHIVVYYVVGADNKTNFNAFYFIDVFTYVTRNSAVPDKPRDGLCNGVPDPLKHASPHVCVTTLNLVVLGTHVGRTPKTGIRWATPSWDGSVTDLLKTSPSPYVLPRQTWSLYVYVCKHN